VATGRTPSVASTILFDARVDSNVYFCILLLREMESHDGFVIAAFMTSRVAALFKQRRQ